MPLHSHLQLIGLIEQLRAHGHETGTFEAKEGLSVPQEIGEYISALSNSAALNSEAFGFLVWGLKDEDLSVAGTDFSYLGKGKGNEDLIPWLRRNLDPDLHFEFEELLYESERVVVLTVEAAKLKPTRFGKEAFIRDGSYKKPLGSVPSHEARLWKAFSTNSYEEGIAREALQASDVLRLLDFASYFAFLGIEPPRSDDGIVEFLVADGFVIQTHTGEYQITNLGAILLARSLKEFPSVKRKALRVTKYDGIDKASPARSQDGTFGYAVGFQGLIKFLNHQIPAMEEFPQGVREVKPLIPEKAVRELVANALIHQDLSVTGTGPTVDIFSNRIEVTNPGRPLVDSNRLIDAPPRSRNEALAALMRRFGICEERGSGWDQIAALVELSDLPAPLIEVDSDFMRVTLFSHRPFKELSKEERIRSVYFHACLQHVRKLRTTNASLRERFRVPEQNKAAVSRLIKDAVTEGLIAVYDDSVGAKSKSYVPFWAK